MSTSYLVAVCNTSLARRCILSAIITADKMGAVKVYLKFVFILSPGVEFNQTSEPETNT